MLHSNKRWEASMIGVVATLKVQPDKTSEFEAVFLDMAAKVKGNEPGCLVYQLTRSKTEAGTYKVLELYASMDDLKAHGGTDYFKAGGVAMTPFMAGRPEIEYLDAVE
jgi:quinol monooxygenase YgiN